MKRAQNKEKLDPLRSRKFPARAGKARNTIYVSWLRGMLREKIVQLMGKSVIFARRNNHFSSVCKAQANYPEKVNVLSEESDSDSAVTVQVRNTC